MAQRINVILVDDIDGSEATETIEFAFDGSQYEIDLNDVHAKELREALFPFTANGRRVGRTKKKATAATTSSNNEASASDIRDWARGQGMEVTDRGRVPQELRDAYNAANPR